MFSVKSLGKYIFACAVIVSTTSACALDCTKVSLSQSVERTTFRDLAHDQACIWTSPLRLRENRNWAGAIPWIGASAALIATDRDVMRDNIVRNPTSVRRFNRASNLGIAAFGGATGLMYLTGLATHDSHLRETGWLTGEAVVNAMALDFAGKGITGRNRPNAKQNPFAFFDGGSAFPSGHATASWAAAAVIAREYPNLPVQLLAYGAATGISASRIAGRQHSPSDVFVGSALGFLVGRYVYKSRHDEYDPSFRDDTQGLAALKLRSANRTYVPIDSPVYLLIDRLAAAGYIKSAILSQRPWSAKECDRLLSEAEENINDQSSDSDQDALAALQKQLQWEMEAPKYALDEVYARFTGISGTPLRDSYHFGQTIVNDYGRPYWSGGNAYLGLAGSVAMGPITFHGRGEYQYAPGGPSYSAATNTAIATRDRTATPLVPSSSSFSDFRLIEAYAALPLKNVEVSFGKQSLWWGPSESGPMMFSSNAPPIYMLRLSQMSPIRLPGLFQYFGAFKIDAFFGKLTDHFYAAHPYIHGQKFSFKPTPNLEFGFSRTVIFAGQGHPLTFHTFWKSFASLGDSSGPTSSPDVGDRRGSFDVSYRVPGFRTLMLTLDSFTDDDPLPLAAPNRAAYTPGFYLEHVPHFKKLDLRVEAPTTDFAVIHGARTSPLPNVGDFFYFNQFYRDGYTSGGQLLGSWIGRDAQGVMGRSNYWFSGEKVLQLSYRHATIDPRFWNRGGNYSNGGASYRTPISNSLQLNASLQWERWNIPLVSSSIKHDAVISFGISWRTPRSDEARNP